VFIGYGGGKMKTKKSDKIVRRHLLVSGTKAEIEKLILDGIGVLGWAKASPVFTKIKKGLVLSVERKSLNDVRAAFEMSKRKVKILKVSGTLKGLGK
jgi:RNase P/RNase MRP subunit POP5